MKLIFCLIYIKISCIYLSSGRYSSTVLFHRIYFLKAIISLNWVVLDLPIFKSNPFYRRQVSFLKVSFSDVQFEMFNYLKFRLVKIISNKYSYLKLVFLTAIAEGGPWASDCAWQKKNNEGGSPLASRSRSPGRESTQRLCTC